MTKNTRIDEETRADDWADARHAEPSEFEPRFVDAAAGTGPIAVQVVDYLGEQLIQLQVQGVEVLLHPKQTGPLVLALLAAGSSVLGFNDEDGDAR